MSGWFRAGIPLQSKGLLLRSLGSAELLQAAIAYWTVSDDIFGSHLVRVLQHKDALLCVDLHQPTDLESPGHCGRDLGEFDSARAYL
jgi:hypothetical protein